MNYPEPHIIQFNKLGKPETGYISVAENKNLPFEIMRIFWTYFGQPNVIRGRHAHHKTEQILIAASGQIEVTTEDLSGNTQTFLLEKANEGLYIPPLNWHTIQQKTEMATQLVLASTEYDEADYIRNYEQFETIKYEQG